MRSRTTMASFKMRRILIAKRSFRIIIRYYELTDKALLRMARIINAADTNLSLIHISEPTRQESRARMPSSA